MAARRPRTAAPAPESPAPTPASEAPTQAPPPVAKPLPGIPYASIRVAGNIHKLRHATNPKLIEATDDQTITLLAGKTAPDGTFIPFVHYLVMPSGVELSQASVTSAIPVASRTAERASRVERLAKRAELLKIKMGERAAAKVQAVESEDEVDDDSIDEDETPSAEEDDGIDI